MARVIKSICPLPKLNTAQTNSTTPSFSNELEIILYYTSHFYPFLCKMGTFCTRPLQNLKACFITSDSAMALIYNIYNIAHFNQPIFPRRYQQEGVYNHWEVYNETAAHLLPCHFKYLDRVAVIFEPLFYPKKSEQFRCYSNRSVTPAPTRAIFT